MTVHERPGKLATTLALVVGTFLLLPLLAVVPVSFTAKRYLSMPGGDYSLRHYRTLVEDPVWLEGLALSLRVGLVSSVLATALALAFCLGLWMYRPRFAGLLSGFALLPMVAPPVVSALTLYFFLVSVGQVNDTLAYDTWAGVALAHAVMVAPFAVLVIGVALGRVDRRIDLAARGMGAGPLARIVRVIVPNIRFGIASALFLTFVLSWDEIGVTLFITSIDAVTLPRVMWMGLRDNIDPAIAAASVVFIAVAVTAILGRATWRALSGRSKTVVPE